MATTYTTPAPANEELSTAVTILPMDYSLVGESSALPLYHMSPPPVAQTEQVSVVNIGVS